jgi:DNA-binding GntR family transcriptional regulator
MAGVKGTGLTKQERVYRHVRERILSGTYGPGYRVVITHIARELDVSALPVREAIRRLEAEGLIVFRPNEGAQVAASEPGFFEHELRVLAVLEGHATALAAPHLSPARLDHLADLTDQMTEAMGRWDSLTFGRLNQDFHAAVYDACPNPPLVDQLRELARKLDAIRRTTFVHIPYRGDAAVQEHHALIALIRDGAPDDQVEAAARQHKLNTLETFRRAREEEQR